MKYKINLMYIVLFVILCGLSCLSSCTYDASFFNRLELPEECAEGLSLCEGKCVTTNTKEHCGACRNACTFDRLCEKQDDDSYQCRCPEGRADCGPNTKCSLLDGKSNNDLRCGDCNTMCLNNEQCENNACVCPIGDDVLRDDKGKPLSGEALFAEYLKNDDNCGFCGNKCKGVGEHCVLGQCTKTECSDVEGREECHFSLPDGREECQACEQNCMSKSGLGEGQTALVPKTEYIEVTMRVNDSKFSPKAYTKGDNGGFKLKRVTGCTCDDLTTVTCEADSADRCNNGVCVCGANKTPCVDGTTCTSEGCQSICDEFKRACFASITCKDQLCHCPDAKTQENSKNYAHCIDGLKCSDGKCYCLTSAGKNVECGVRGDHCKDMQCVCGDLGKACEGDAVCKDKECYCGQSKGCDERLSPHCVNDECVCGKTGGPCPGSQVCVDGKCLCTEDSDCGSNESCDEDSGQCTCGGANLCAKGSTCTEAGYCSCSNNGNCNDAEVCKDVKGFGELCVCGPNDRQKSCKLGVKCEWINNSRGYKCIADDASACYEGERIRDKDKKHCVCGDEKLACGPGKSCQDGKCK